MLSLGKALAPLPLTLVRISSNIFSAVSLNSVLGSQRCINTLYGAETCEDCVKSYAISGPRKNLKKMKKPDPFKNKHPCWQSLRRTEYKCRTDPEFLLDSFIDAKKKCLGDPCAWDAPRADLKHYRPTDKLKRKYARTWIKCVMKRRKMKMKCTCKPVQYKRRKFARVKRSHSMCDQNPCTLGSPKLELAVCKPMIKTVCPRMTMPFCKPGIVPPKCKRSARKPAKCRKRLTKYPAFSECLMDPLPIAPPVECNCLKTPSMCSVWEYYRNRKS